MRQPRNYDALRSTQQKVDAQQNAPEAEKEAPHRPDDSLTPSRSWTGRGDMVSQQESALNWVKQNYADRQKLMEARNIAEAAAERETAEQSKDLEKDDPEK